MISFFLSTKPRELIYAARSQNKKAVSEREREGALEMLAILFLECAQFLKVPSAVQLWVLFSMYIILS